MEIAALPGLYLIYSQNVWTLLPVVLNLQLSILSSILIFIIAFAF